MRTTPKYQLCRILRWMILGHGCKTFPYPDDPSGFDGVYVPLLVDDLARFLDAFKDYPDFAGFSVTIPHKVRPCMCTRGTAQSVHTSPSTGGRPAACHAHVRRALPA